MKYFTYVRALLLFLFIFNTSLFAQKTQLNDENPTFIISLSDFQAKLQNAPFESNNLTSETLASAANIMVELPLPNGDKQSFRVIETAVMSPTLAVKFPMIKTYRLYAVDKKESSGGALTVSPSGINAIVFTEKGNVMIAPKDVNKNEYQSIYQGLEETEPCGINEEHLKFGKLINSGGNTLNFTNGVTLRTYRIAITTTGEFYTNNGSTLVSAQAAVVSMVNSLKAVYEKELAVTFTLVATQIYTDPATDPFSGSNATTAAIAFGALATSDPTNFAIANYDIGHVLQHSPGGGGVAYLASTCRNNNVSSTLSPIKAGGFSGGTTTVLATFIHEVGHQFYAGHVFNSVSGSCNGNIMTDFAVEPGSGSTFMSYWGSCSPDNISGTVNRTYFNGMNLDDMTFFLGATGYGTCSVNTPTGNTPPVALSGGSKTIPKGTPFTLIGNGTDVDGDPLTFTWEQNDIDLTATPTRGGADDAQNSTAAPIFRSFPPSASGNVRSFPVLNTLLSGLPNNDEALPQVARTVNMRLTARDNKATGGGIDDDEMVLTIDNSGPFLITSQNTNTFWAVGGTATITWSVNGTNIAPLSVSTVDVLLSTDGGLTFPITLLSATPNDGTQTITVPNNLTTTGRIKIKPSGTSHIFFDVNNSPINIVSTITCASEASALTPTTAVIADLGATALNLNLYAYSAGTTVTATTTTADPQMQLTGFTSVGACSAPYSNAPHIKTFTFRVSAAGVYTFSGISGVGSVNLYQNSYDPNNSCTNWLASSYNMTTNTLNSSIQAVPSLNPGTTYILAIMPGFSTGTVGTTTINFSGPGSIQVPVPATNSFYSYAYVIVNSNTGNIDGIQNTSDLSSFPVGSYAVRGLSYLTGANLTSFIGQPASNLQTALPTTTICGQYSSTIVNVTINCPAITAPTGVPASRCGTGTVELSATGCAGTYNWYDASTGGSSLAATAAFTTPSIATTTTYYVDCTVGTCISTRASTVATITDLTLTVTSPTIISGNTATITATGCTGGTVSWFNVATGGTALGTGLSYITAILTNPPSSQEFYASCTVGACTSPNRVVSTVTVSPACNSTTMNLVSTANDISTTGTVKHENDANIIAQNKITPVAGTYVKYDAKNHILLLPGFVATSAANAHFEAYIDGCGNK